MVLTASDEGQHDFPEVKASESNEGSLLFRKADRSAHAPAVLNAINCGPHVRINYTEREVERTSADSMPGGGVFRPSTPTIVPLKSLVPSSLLQPVIEQEAILGGGSGSRVVVHRESVVPTPYP